MRARHKGFTLVEVVVASMIVLVLAAIAMPNVIDYMNAKRASDTAQMLADLGSAITDPANGDGFFQLVRTGNAGTNTYPGQISELVNPLLTNSALDRNSCGGTFTTTAQAFWNTSGPFFGTLINTQGGLNTPLGLIQDSMPRTPPATNTTQTAPGVLRIQGLAWLVDDVLELDRIVDASDSATKGQVRFTVLTGTQAGYADMEFLVPVAGRC